MARVTDPVCGMSIDPERAPAREPHGDHFHFFCSAECARAFREAPARYTATENRTELDVMRRDPMPPRTTEGITAPMFGSAGSGGAEFERIPEEDDPRDA